MAGKTVITFGTFDVLHVGHVRVLNRSAALGDRLVVGVSSDVTFEDLTSRFLEAEHSLYVSSLQQIVSGRYRVEGRRVLSLDEAKTGSAPHGW